MNLQTARPLSDLGIASWAGSMPRFSALSDGDVKAIIAYLRSLPATRSEIPESECPPIKPAPTDGGVTDM